MRIIFVPELSIGKGIVRVAQQLYALQQDVLQLNDRIRIAQCHTRDHTSVLPLSIAACKQCQGDSHHLMNCGCIFIHGKSIFQTQLKPLFFAVPHQRQKLSSQHRGNAQNLSLPELLSPPDRNVGLTEPF